MQTRRTDDTGLCLKLLWRKVILSFLAAGNVCSIRKMKTWEEEMQGTVWV